MRRKHQSRERLRKSEREAKAQEEQGKEVSAQIEREGQARKGKAQEREADAQEGHGGEMTTQEKCVEEKKETNSMQENDVSNRHMAWWKNAWWIRVDSGPHMRTARGRRRVWRAARRAADQARDNDGVGETQSFAEEAEGETGGRKKWEQGTTGRKERNTLRVFFHFANATTPTAAAAAAAATAAMRLQ